MAVPQTPSLQPSRTKCICNTYLDKVKRIITCSNVCFVLFLFILSASDPIFKTITLVSAMLAFPSAGRERQSGRPLLRQGYSRLVFCSANLFTLGVSCESLVLEDMDGAWTNAC